MARYKKNMQQMKLMFKIEKASDQPEKEQAVPHMMPENAPSKPLLSDAISQGVKNVVTKLLLCIPSEVPKDW